MKIRGSTNQQIKIRIEPEAGTTSPRKVHESPAKTRRIRVPSARNARDVRLQRTSEVSPDKTERKTTAFWKKSAKTKRFWKKIPSLQQTRRTRPQPPSRRREIPSEMKNIFTSTYTVCVYFCGGGNSVAITRLPFIYYIVL